MKSLRVFSDQLKAMYLFTVLGVSTVVLFQNCGDGGFRANLNSASSGFASANGIGSEANSFARSGMTPVVLDAASFSLDSDDDGISDIMEEYFYGTDPGLKDSDSDTVSDGDELKMGSDPLAASSTLVIDITLDSDSDGLTDAEEVSLGTNPNNPDSDSDFIADGIEVNTLKTNPLKMDSDLDGVIDGAEVSFGFNPSVANGNTVPVLSVDVDSDGLSDVYEQTIQTDPNNADSDGDFLTDGGEIYIFLTLPKSLDSNGNNLDDGLEVLQSSVDLQARYDVNSSNQTDGGLSQGSPIDGGWSAFQPNGPWSDAARSCGTRPTLRTCTNPAPANGGAQCVGSATSSQSQTCGPNPVNGGWTAFQPNGPWSDAARSCGTRPTLRTCTNPAPANGGAQCVGSATSSQSLTCGPNPVNGGWSAFQPNGPWSDAARSCGTRPTLRTCTNPAPANGGAQCVGSATSSQSQTCGPNPVDGGWTAFQPNGPWSDAARSCGTRPTLRTCTNPAPANGGAQCVGSATSSQSLTCGPNPVNGGWTGYTYGPWSNSAYSCGTRNGTRSCTNPIPANGGNECVGSSTSSQQRTCPTPVNGGWTAFQPNGPWSDAARSCGTRPTLRTCTNPAPAYGGAQCSGSATSSQSVTCGPDPINGGWTGYTYGSWSNTTYSCGTRRGTRSCTNPSPANGGNNCAGSTTYTQQKTCPTPRNGGWTSYGAYGPWSNAASSCGYRTRRRTCTNPTPAYGGADCVGSAAQTEYGTCPVAVNGGWSGWQYGAWSNSAGQCGSRTRTRSCNSPSPANGGAQCAGNSSENETRSCDYWVNATGRPDGVCPSGLTAVNCASGEAGPRDQGINFIHGTWGGATSPGTVVVSRYNMFFCYGSNLRDNNHTDRVVAYRCTSGGSQVPVEIVAPVEGDRGAPVR